MPRLHAIVRGRVQGVFFRASILDRAQMLGLSGWVRNRSDGGVEVVAEGEADALRALGTYAARGPRGADVHDVEILEEPESGEFTGFAIRPDA